MDSLGRSIVLTILGLLTLVLLGIALSLHYVRIDLTRDRVFTVSEVSKGLFRELREPLTITYWVSGRLRRISPIPTEIEDLLVEYARRSGGRIRLQILDPLDDARVGDIETLGLLPQQIQVVERDERASVLVYSGIVLSYLDGYEVLPIVFDTASLEYDLVLRIRRLLDGRPRSLAVLNARSGVNPSATYGLLSSFLARSFEIRELGRGETIPPDLSVLFVFGGLDLDGDVVESIARFLAHGGRVLLGLERVEVDLGRNLAVSTLPAGPLHRYLSGLGIEVEEALILDQAFKPIPVQRGTVGVQSLEPYPPWVSVVDSGLSPTHPVTSRFQGLDLFWASPLRVSERPGLRVERLLSSSPDSWLMRAPFATGPFDEALRRQGAEAGPHVMAVAVSGDFGRGPGGRLIVLGDADAAADMVQFSDSLYNLAFFANAADWLAADEDLLTIRTRALRRERLAAIADPAERAAAVAFLYFLNLVLVPAAVLVFALVRFRRRRERGKADRGSAGGAS